MKILFFCLVLSAPILSVASTTFVGFLEKAGVRRAFEYKNGEWQTSFLPVNNSEELEKAATKYATPNKWTLFFDGKTYGDVLTKPFITYTFYKEIGLQQLVSKNMNLKFRKIESKFSGWEGDNLRPIVASSLNEITDPDEWKSTDFGAVDKSIYNDMRVRLKGKIYFCANEGCEGKPTVRDLKDDEIKPSVAYKDLKGNQLKSVTLKFPTKANAYCEIEGDNCSGEGPFWYFKSSAGDIKFLTAAAALIDAADINKDGISELLFWISEYNSDGYELVDGKSHKVKRATWSYH